MTSVTALWPRGTLQPRRGRATSGLCPLGLPARVSGPPEGGADLGGSLSCTPRVCRAPPALHSLSCVLSRAGPGSQGWQLWGRPRDSPLGGLCPHRCCSPTREVSLGQNWRAVRNRRPEPCVPLRAGPGNPEEAIGLPSDVVETAPTFESREAGTKCCLNQPPAEWPQQATQVHPASTSLTGLWGL